MRIEGGLPNLNFYMPQTVSRVSAPAESQNTNPYYGPGVIVDISQQARDAYKQSLADPNAIDGTKGIDAMQGMEGCQTCENRRYVDQSSDSSVSYQSPTHISPEQSAGKVMAHEREHITNDQAKAEKEDRRVVSQSVSLSTSICPECGKMYVSGGSARTVTASKNNDKTPDAAQAEGNTTTIADETNT